MIYNQSQVLDCTSLPYHGIGSQNERALRPCLPMDIVEMALDAKALAQFDADVKNLDLSKCRHMCMEYEYSLDYSTGNVDIDVVNEVFQDTEEPLQNAMAVKIHFGSFEVRKCIIYQDSLASFLGEFRR